MQPHDLTTRRRHVYSTLLYVLISLGIGCGSPTSPDATDFSGHWEGVWIRQGCVESGVAIGGGFCHLDDVNRLVLDLAQTGDRLTGTVSVSVQPTGGLFAVPVTGSVAHGPDRIVVLTGSLSTVGGVLAIDRLNATISQDAFHPEIALLGGSLGLTITAPPSAGIGTVVQGGPFTRVRQ